MKAKKFEGKLTLKKATICDLSAMEKNEVKGGIIIPVTKLSCNGTLCANSDYYCC
jgi:hypothetical protein